MWCTIFTGTYVSEHLVAMKGRGSTALERRISLYSELIQQRTVKSSAFQCPSAYFEGSIENTPEIYTKVHFHLSGSDAGP